MYFDKLYALDIKLTRRNGSEKVLCPQCSNARKNKRDKCLSVNITNGDYHCHNCGWKGNVRSHDRKHISKQKFELPPQDVIKNIQLKEKIIEWFANRKISKETLDKFMVFGKEHFMPQTGKKESCICFPYFRDGQIVNIKYRDGRKNFCMVAKAELILYNLSSIGDKKYCIIVEGEPDCLATYESGFGKDYENIPTKVDEESGEVLESKENELGKWAVVSVPSGASNGDQKLEYLDNCSDWFLGLHEIIIATDNDVAGKSLRDELIRRLGVERCKTISYPIEECVPLENGLKRRCKDLNEVLQYLGKDVVINTINNAEFIPVDGVYYVGDIFESMLDNFKKGIQLAPTTRFNEMDLYFRWKKGDINVVTGYANHGKTFFILQLMLTKSIWDGWKWAVFCPENYPANDFYDDLIEMYVGKWLSTMSEHEYVEAAEFIDRHIFYVYPEDSHDLNSINERFRHLILKKGVDGVLLDPWNQLDHLQKPYQREDQYLSEALKDVKRFALLNNIVYNIVAHPKNPTLQEGRILPVADTYDLSGGAMWGNKADQITSYHRPRFHEDKNSPDVEIYQQKVKRKRTGGQLGHFPLTLVWGKKRYACSDGSMPCDPILAKKTEQKKTENYIQTNFDGNGWMPIKDVEDF